MKLLQYQLTIIIVLACVLFSTNLNSQTENSFVSIKYGISSPQGEYGESDNLKKSGFAKSGFNVGLEGIIFLSDNIAWDLNFGCQVHKMDDYKISELYKHSEGIYNFNLNPGAYQVYNLMTGFLLDLPLNQRIFLNLKLLGGLFNTITPKASGFVVDSRFIYRYFSNKKVSENNFTLLIGGGLRVKTSNHSSLQLIVEYSGAKPNIVYDDNINFVINNEKVSFMNISIGFNIFLPKIY